MGILLPDPGLVFWTTLSFLTLLLILRKYAWKPILRALRVREEYIEFSLRDAENAKIELQKLDETQKQMLESANAEKDALIKEAREIRDQIIAEAKSSAQAESAKIIEQTRQQIQNEKAEAMAGIRKQIGLLSLEIAEKILREQMKDASKQKALIDQYLEDVSFN